MQYFFNQRLWLVAVAASLSIPAMGQAATPTLQNVAYGTNSQQVLDFYKATSTTPTPVMFYVHGGAWVSGDKGTPDFVDQCLANGISVASINYRLIDQATPANNTSPPVKAAFDDTARALQFVRSKASTWNLDKTRVSAVGGSAGGYNALWLAFHSDMANPQSTDPIARESTRVTSAFAFVPQTTLDPKQMREWMPGIDYGQQAFGLPDFQTFYNQRDALLPTIKEYSPYYLASADDPSVYLYYDTAPALGTNNSTDLVHSSNWGAGLVAQLNALGVKNEFNYPGATVAHPDGFSFIKDSLAASTPEPGCIALLATGGGLLLSRQKRSRSVK